MTTTLNTNNNKTFGKSSSNVPYVVETYQDLLKNRIVGDCPNGVIYCEPRWLIFSSSDSYKKPCYGEFTITNSDPFTVAWCIKTKDKLMRLSQSHGVLKAGERVRLTIFITSSDDWPRDVTEYTGRRIMLIVENLRIPDFIRPKSKEESKRMSRDIFHYSATNNPLLRMYTKVNLILQ
ncbi:hypothetical protein DICVIV_11419 [Dictyocaulus viviparus]|uniref:MSP domain-containing protein n=1 Tax=Dictyocaulus viviparus TaxID=29172 RepID=A0A0D8XDA1_DICVI|nr:hypothetical protein DICVIV_11419 [Dictyocaulus viviparus]